MRTTSFLVVALAASACTTETGGPESADNAAELAAATIAGAPSRSLLATCNAADYGAVGDGVHDDRAALQAALDACATVTVPAGRFLITKGAGAWGVRLLAGQALIGAGRDLTTLVQAPGSASSVRVLHVAGDDVTIADLALDGDKAHQSPDEHRAGVFITGSLRAVVRRVTAHDFTGDGFYVHIGSNDVVLDDVRAEANDRNGVTFGGGTAGGTVTGSTFIGNGAQQLDSEPGAGYTVDGVTVRGCTLDAAGASNDYVLTMSGSGSASRSRGWTVTGNVINGATFAVWLDSSVIADNVGVNPSTKSCFTVYRRSMGVTISGNTCAQTQADVDGLGGILVVGTGAANMPEIVSVIDNTITVTGNARSMGVWVQGAVSTYVAGNTLIGPSLPAASYAGVYLRTTIFEAPLRSAIVVNNVISNWGDAALRVAGNTVDGVSATIDYVELRDNVLGDDDATPTQLRAVIIDANAVPKAQVRTGNTCTGATSCAGANL